MSLANAISKRSLQLNHRHHGVWGRTVHPDLAVPIHGHEAKGWINRIVDDVDRDAVALDDRSPVVHSGAAERIHPDSDARVADRFHVHHAGEITDVRIDVVVTMSTSQRGKRDRKECAVTVAQAVSKDCVGRSARSTR